MTHYKRIVAFSAAFGALMMAPLAFAQDTPTELPHFYPAKAWEVGSLKVVTDYSGECIIQTEFNNGFLLQMNGSSNWVQQLNLNIRQAAFTVGNPYDVIVSVPGQPSEVIKGVANRGNIISVPMKGRKELYKAMRDNGVVDIGIEGNEFRFFLTGFNQAANKFELCMAGGAPGVVASKNVREHAGDQGLGGIVDESKDMSVSSGDMSDAEKDFLVNESIAFEQQEVAIKDTPVTPVAEPEDKKKSLDTSVEKSQNFTEEEAVAALNASAVEAIRPQDSKPAMTEQAETVMQDEMPQETLVALDDSDISAEPFTPEPMAGDAVEMKTERIDAPEPIVVMMDAPEEIPETPVDARKAVVVEKVEIESVPDVAPANIAVAESFLDEPEKSIDMPRMKVNKNTTQGEMDFRKVDIETADTAALARIVALEKELEDARMKNAALNEELEVSLKESKQEVMTVQSENWNLERATMRYNEAERQMKSLGQQLQKERAQWAMEKKELETMLFDPEVTSQEQLARLSVLEQELAKTKAELEAARAGMTPQ